MLAVDTDGQVWALGNNANGKLGIGGTSTAYTPTLVKTSSTEILSGVERVAAGARNSAALAQDGVVYVWGDNTYGQRGIEAKNSKYSQYASFTVKGASAGDNADGALNDFIDITIGDTFISALRRDGNVFSWGSGSYGQIGKGFFTEALAPTQAVNGESASSTAYLRNIVKISAGAYHNIALSDDSSVYAWGRNANGQLGNNTITTNDSIDNANNYNANSPKRVLISYDGENMQNLDGIVNVNAGVNSSMAVGRDGYLYSWGSGANNTTGVGSTANSLTAKYTKRGESFYSDDATDRIGWITSATIGDMGTSVVRYDGSVYSWGKNSTYNVGDFSSVERTEPVQTGLREDRREAIGVATLYTDSVATEVYNDDVNAANYNPLPQKITLSKNQYLEINKSDIYDYHMVGFNLIYNNNDRHSTAVQAYNTDVDEQTVLDRITATSIDTSIVSAEDNNNIITIRPNSEHRYTNTFITLYNTSTNFVGVLEVSVKEVDTEVTPMIVSGDHHTLALMSDGTVWAWGNNTYGQLGNGIRSNDTHNSYPADGDEKRNDFLYPVKVNIPSDVKIKSIAVGKRHSLALTENGEVYIWGYTEVNNIVWGDYYQNNIVTRTGYHKSSYKSVVGDANQERRYGIVTPKLVKLDSDNTQNLTDVISIAAGDDVSYAVKADGTVWAWGHNGTSGKLGINKYNSMYSVTKTIAESRYVDFTIPGHWEYDEYVPSTTHREQAYNWTSLDYPWYLWTEYGKENAVQVIGPYAGGYLNNAVSVRTSGDSVYVIKADGTVWAWGSNMYGVLANETNVNNDTRRGYPLQVYKGDGYSADKYLKNIVDIQVGANNKERNKRAIGTQINLDETTVIALARNITVDDTTKDTKQYNNQGYVYVWGKVVSDNATVNSVSAPTRETTLENVTAVSAGGNTVMTLSLDPDTYKHSTYAWGNNTFGQLGNNTTDSTSTPSEVLKGENVYSDNDYIEDAIQITNGAYFSAAMLHNGTIWAWGSNRNGQFGNNYRVNSLIPVQSGDRAADILTVADNDGDSIPLVATITEGETLDLGRIKYEHIPGFEFAHYAYSDVINANDGVTYNTSNSDVATVNSNGVVSANTNGIYGQTTISFEKEISPVNDGVYTGLLDEPILYKGQLIVKVIKSGDDKVAIPMTKSGGSFTVALMDNGTVWTWGSGNLGDGTSSASYYPVQVVTSVSSTGERIYLDNIVSIAAGNTHALALDANGRVWTWGSNGSGQLGRSGSTNVAAEVSIVGDTDDSTNIIAIAAGKEHSLALTSDGRVYAWGLNNYGQIGHGTSGTHSVYNYTGDVAKYETPVIVMDLNNGRATQIHSIVSISAGGDSSILVRGDGTVFTFGKADNGQLGYGENLTANKGEKDNISDSKVNSAYHKTVPSQVINRSDDDITLDGGITNTYMQNVAEADMGSEHSVLLVNNGLVYSTGLGTSGQLGNGASNSSDGYVRVVDSDGNYLENAVNVSAGYNQSATVTRGSNLYMWGNNASKQLGDDSATTKSSATRVVKGHNIHETGDYLSNITAVSLGNTVTTAIKSDGTVWAFGTNSSGSLGDFVNYDYTGAHLVGPVDYYALNFDNIEGGHIRIPENSTYTIDNINLKYVAGFNLHDDSDFRDASGDYSFESSDPRIATVDSNGTITPVGNGNYGKVVITVTDNNTGYRGLIVADVYNVSDRYTKIAVPMIASGLDFTVALKSDGSVWTWGNNSSGQLGIGYTTLDADGKVEKLSTASNSMSRISSWAEPLQVADTNGLGTLSNIISIVAGDNFAMALSADGAVYTWGNGSNGKLGDNNTSSHNAYYPQRVVRGVADTYTSETVATQASSTGDETTDPEPVVEEYLSGILEISAGKDYALALDKNGHVLAWGTNTNSKLGLNYRSVTDNMGVPSYVVAGAMASDDPFVLNADRTNSTRNTQSTNRLSNIVSIDAGDNHAVAIADNGSVYAWGDNSEGQLGIEPNTSKRFSNYDGKAYAYAPIKVQRGDRDMVSAYDDEFMYDAVQVSAGKAHTLIRSKDYNTYATGDNSNGQLGIDSGDVTSPKYVDVDGNSIYNISAGGNSSAFIGGTDVNDNLIYTVGNNGSGQLGIDSVINKSTPTRVHDSVRSDVGDLLLFDDAFVADYGSQHLTIMKQDGSVYTTGANGYGQLGDNTTIKSYIPVHVSKEEVDTLELQNVEIKENSDNSVDESYVTPDYLEITEDQYVDFNRDQIMNKRMVGFNLYEDDILTPIDDKSQIEFTSSDTSIGNFASGIDELHTTSPTKAGPTIVTIENKANGYKAFVTVTVKGDTVWPSGSKVAVGKNFSIALKENGTLWTWGDNSHGQLGDGTLLSKKYPVQVLDEDGNPIKDIVRLAAGDDYVFAVDKNGKIYTWGVSISGGSDMTSPVEVENTIGDEIEDIVSGSNYVLVLTTHGDVFSYGVDNSQGQLGNDVIAPSTASFTKISALKDIRSIAAGDSHNLAVDTNGKVWTWGANLHKQLGRTVSSGGGSGSSGGTSDDDSSDADADGDDADTALQATTASADYDATPAVVEGLSNVKYVAAGSAHSVAVTEETLADGTTVTKVYAWGYNSKGQLGIDDKTVTESVTPMLVVAGEAAGKDSTVDANSDEYLSNILGVTAGGNQTLVITNNYEVYTWGGDEKGQLGVDSKIDRFAPVKVWKGDTFNQDEDPYLKNVIGAAMGANHTVIIRDDGYVWAWGDNTSGQLGTVTVDLAKTPVQVGNTNSNTLSFQKAIVYTDENSTGDTISPLPSSVVIDKTGKIEIDMSEIYEQYMVGFNLFNKADKQKIASEDIANIQYSSSIPNIATVSANGNTATVMPTGNTFGTTVITFRNSRNGYVGTINVTVKGDKMESIVASSLTAGTNFHAALKADGTVWTWGDNTYGQLGDGTKITRGYPIQVKFQNGRDDSASTFGGNNAATAIAAGNNHLLILANGVVYAVGDNSKGQLGNGATGTTESIVVPVMIDETTTLTGVKNIAAGDDFSMALLEDGSIYAWGSNKSGQLGDGTTTDSAYAVKVLAGRSGTNAYDPDNNDYYLNDIVSISAGQAFAMALKNDGTVYTWGDNSKGQLGDGTRVNKPTPIQVLRGESPEEETNVAPAGSDYLINIVMISAGANHALALTKTGYVWAWGDNTYGQNGDWTTDNNERHYLPLQVRDISKADQSTGNTTGRLKNITAISAKNNQSFAINEEGYLYGWGYNGQRQLGINNSLNQTLPQKVLKGQTNNDESYIKFVSNVAAGTNNTVAELDDGYVYTWSRNTEWQLGKFDGTSSTYDVSTPAYTGERAEDLIEFFDAEGNKINYLTTIETGATIEIDSYKHHHMYGFNLENDDTHEPLDGTFTYHSNNENVATVVNGVITAGTHTGTAIITITHDSGITSEISVTVTQAGRTATPMVAGGSEFAVALLDNGEVWTWGSNEKGQLGNGLTENTTYPVQVSLPEGVKAKYVAAGINTAYAVTTDGYVYAWGNNENGMIGNGTSDKDEVNRTPVRVQEKTSTGVLVDLSNIARIAVGENHVLALSTDGYVYAWGNNSNGQLGNGDTSSTNEKFHDNDTTDGIYAAQKVYRGESAATNDDWYIQDVIDIAAGKSFSVALKADGTVWTWGLNTSYQLGIGDTMTRPVPTQVLAGASSTTEKYLKNITAVAAGEGHVLVATTDGTMYSWGYNNWGQLGNNTTTTATKPVKVSNITNVAAISANYYNSMAMTSDGSVYTWGWNEYGQIGDGSYRYDTFYLHHHDSYSHDHWNDPTYMNKTVPTQVVKGVTGSDTAYISNIWNISAGRINMYVIHEDGYVYAWGSNSKGQTGDDTNTKDGNYVSLHNGTRLEYHAMDNTPTQVGDFETKTLVVNNYDVVTTMGRDETIQLNTSDFERNYRSGFNVKYHNEDQSGALTAGENLTFTSLDESIAVVSSTGLISVPSEFKLGETTIRIKTDDGFVGTLVVRVKRSADTVAVPMVASGNNFTMALREDGTVWAWGLNSSGQLGDGTKVTRSYPVRVKNTDGTGLLENIVYIAAGGSSAVAIDKDGRVYGWGSGTSNGLGSKQESLLPSPVVTSYEETVIETDDGEGNVVKETTVTKTELVGAVAAAGGANHMLVLMGNGQVYAWGANSYGQVGINTTDNVYVATLVQKSNGIEPIEDAVKVSAISNTSLILTSDGQVYAWGQNVTGTATVGYHATVNLGGYLGTGYSIRHRFTNRNSFNPTNTYENRLRPTKVLIADTLQTADYANKYFNGAMDIAAGTYHSVAINDNYVYTWGYNGNSQLGDGTTTDLRHPEKVTAFAENQVSHIYALGSGSAAMTSDGHVYTWGSAAKSNTTPALVNKGEADSNEDVIDNVWYVSTGLSHLTAFRANSDATKAYIYAWGSNNYGQLGDSSFVNATEPRQVGDREARVIEINNAVVSEDTVGYGTPGKTYTGVIPSLVRVTEEQILTIDPSEINERYYEGFNFFAENTLDNTDYSGNYKFYSSDETVATVAEENGKWVVTPIIDTEYHKGGQTTITVVNTATGATGAFILGVYGGKLTPNSTSRDGSGYTKETASPLVSTNLYHSVALKYDGTVYAWGRNDYGQVSTKDGENSIMNTPVQIYSVEYDAEGNAQYTLLENIIDVAAGGYHSLAVDSDGHVWSWGLNDKGQLGYGTTENSGAAQMVMIGDNQPMENIVAVAAGNKHSLALTADGHVYAWGDNTYDQLGASSTVDGDFDKYPVHVTQGTSASGTYTDENGVVTTDEHLSNIIQISAGDNYSAALKADGTVYVWGINNYTVGGKQSSSKGTNDTRMAPYQIISGDYDNSKIKTDSRFDAAYIQTVAKISAGSNHLMMLTNKYYGETDVFAIGLNGNYQLGDETTTTRDYPVLSVRPSDLADSSRTVNNIISIAAGQAHSLVLGESTAEDNFKYSVWAWGSNSNGQIGMNTNTANYPKPQHVRSQYLEDEENAVSPYIESVFAIAAGANSTAIDLEGYVYMWGINNYSQIGDFTTETRLYPYQVGELPYKSIIFKDVYVVNRNTGVVEEYYATLPKHINMRKDQLLYIDVNQMYNRYFKGFTLLSDTEEYPVDRFDPNDNTSWVDPYDQNGDLKPIRDGEDHIKFTTSDETVAIINEDEDPVSTMLEEKVFNADGITRRYIVVKPIEETEKFGSTVISAHNEDPYVNTGNEDIDDHHAYAGYTGAVNISIIPGEEIPPMVVSKGDHAIAINIYGEVWTWGRNDKGQLGDGTTVDRSYPVQVMITNEDGQLVPLKNVMIVAVGEKHSVALTRDGILYTWGDNSKGQLGSGNSASALAYSTRPVTVAGENNSSKSLSEMLAEKNESISNIAAGRDHTLAVSNQGNLYSWGANTYGQLGVNSRDNRYFPVQVKGYNGGGYLTDVILIGAGAEHSLAVRTDGSVWSWGRNNKGQLGQSTNGVNNTYKDMQTPDRVLKGEYDTGNADDRYIKNVDALSAGENFSVVTTRDRNVYAWGDNTYGQLGNDKTTATISTPVHVKSSDGTYLTGISMVSGGANHVIAMSNTNDIYAWGDNSKAQYHEVANTHVANKITDKDSLNPENDDVFTSFSRVTAGWNYSVILTNNGYLWALGNNTYGQLGDMTETDSDEPVRVGFKSEDILNLTKVTVSHSDGTTTEYTDDNVPAQIDITTRETVTFDPSSYEALHHMAFNLRTIHTKDATKDVTANVGTIKFYSSNPKIAEVDENTGVVTPNGNNQYGKTTITAYAEKTDGDKTYIYVAETVISVGVETDDMKKSVPMIASGSTHTVVLKPNGTVWTWGQDTYGQLGDNDSETKAYAVEVVKEGNIILDNVKEVAAGTAHSLALTKDGKIYAWGSNSYGQLGITDATSGKPTGASKSAVAVELIYANDGSELPKFVSIAAGDYFSVALAEDGSVWSWGRNVNGQLGHGDFGTGYTYYAPVKVQQGASASKTVVTGTETTESDGNTVTKNIYGNNIYLEEIVAISAEGDSVMAIKSNGTVLSWGVDSHGQSGTGSLSDKHVPTRAKASDFDGVKDSNGIPMSTTSDTSYLANVTSIAMGKNQSAVIVGDGSYVLTAGDNTTGQTGLGTTEGNTTMFKAVKNVWGSDVKVVEIKSGANHTVARTDDNRLWAWGDNSKGQLGLGDTVIDNSIEMADKPTQVKRGDSYSDDAYINNIWTIGVGGNNSAAIRHDTVVGSDVVWSWGNNATRQLGNMIDNQSYMPVQSGERETRRVLVIHIDKHTANGQTIPYTIQLPQKAEDAVDVSLTNLPQISIGTGDYLQVDIDKIYEVYESGFVLETSGEMVQVTGASFASSNVEVVYVDGAATSGTLRPTEKGAYNSAVITVTNPKTNSEGVFVVNVTKTNDAVASSSVSTGTSHTLVLKENGTLWTWGDNSKGQLGDGPTSEGVTGGSISDDYIHRSFTYTGTGDLNYTAFPVQVKTAKDTPLVNVVSASANKDYNVAADANGDVYIWGSVNGLSYTYAQKMAGFEGKNIIAVSAGYTHFIALSKDGYVYSWGANSYGQLGNNTTSNVTSLSGVTQVVGQSGENYLYDIVKIAANGNSSAAVRSDGTLWTWGANKSSQLGDGTSTNKTTPIQVIRGESNPEYDNREDNSNYYVYLQNVKDVSVGEDHMIAMTEDGSVYTWGSNKYGQLGVNIDGDSVNHAVKVDTSAITAVTDENGNADEITAVYAGKHYSAIITREGHMYVSGRNTDDTEGTNYVTGKLGTGTTDEFYIRIYFCCDRFEVRKG